MKNNQTLFDLTGEFARLNDLLADFDGDVTDADKEAAIDRILAEADENHELLKQKIDGYISVIAENEASAEIRMTESKRLQTLANQNSANAAKLKERLLFAMKNVLRRDQLDTRFHTLKVTKAGGKRALTVNEQVSSQDYLNAIQDRFIKIIPPQPAIKTLDTDAVRAALEAGEDLSFAQLSERREILKIK
jgi:hypothetical protein